jgi:beta-lactamase superfamily II metal-dependent hydrolase
MVIKYIQEDFVALRREPQSNAKPFLTLAFGDKVEVLENEGIPGWTKVQALTHWDGKSIGWIKGNPPLGDKGLLKMSMVDVQQGDGLILETPGEKIILIDGGDNKLFARHAAARFRHRESTDEEPLGIDAIIITHGDADHFDGLNDIRRSETLPKYQARKRLFIHPKRVFHNGLVKSPQKRNGKNIPDEERFGRTSIVDDKLYAIDLVDDPRHVSEENQSAPFKRWATSLDHWESRGPIEVKRLEFGLDEDEIFSFLHEEGVKVELQGPFTQLVEDPDAGNEVPGLPFFNTPSKSAVMHLEQGDSRDSPSASHTINGHSITFRLTFGNVRFAFTGDQNKESMEKLFKHVGEENLESEILKVPHHGSHDFDFQALKAISPVVALISSGDEDVFHEHIHPRATLLAALGKVMRLDTGVIFSTELAAFFHKRDYSHKREVLKEFFKDSEQDTFTREEVRKLFVGKLDDGDPDAYFGFERTNFGIIHVRTDGERVLVFSHSGKKGTNEAYSFTVRVQNGEHVVEFAKKVTTR